MGVRRVLVTGATGGVARMLLPWLSSHYDVTRTDRLPVAGSRTGDLQDAGFVAEVAEGVDAIVHLAANPNPRATWAELAGPNIEAVANILGSGVRKIVLASSVHAMGQYAMAGRTPIDREWPPAPCCAYGATKAFAEALGRMYAYRDGISVVALRLGATVERPPSSNVLGGWLGPRDLHHLVERALVADVGFSVCFGVSANTRCEWDRSNDIGYVAAEDSEIFADSVTDNGRWALCAAAEPTVRSRS